MESLDEAMTRADGILDLHDYVRTVKGAVRDVFKSLDPSVEMRDTDYFNHSAVPDFILRWPNRDERPMYLRRSFEEIVGGGDVARLAGAAPVVVSLKERHNTPAEVRLRTELREPGQRRNVLVAGSRAVDSIVSAPSQESPLKNIVGAELLPQGRGLLDESAAASITQPSGSSTEALADLLSEKAMTVVRDSAELILAAVSGGVDTPSLSVDRFTVEEARQLLPWLLTSPTVRRDQAFWQAVGSRVSLKVLEQIAPALADADLSPLMFRVWGEWTAKRAYRGLADPDFDADSSAAPAWRMRDKVLSLEVGTTAVRFATDGRALSGKPSLSSATWEKIRERIGDYRLLDVALRGVSRTILLNANQSPDIREDADTIHATLDDVYLVDEISVQAGLRDQNRVVRLNFGSELAFNEGNASLRDLAAALLGVVQYNSPVDIRSLEDGPLVP